MKFSLFFRRFNVLLLCAFLCFGASILQAQTTSFTYQGRLTDSTATPPMSGTYDFQFTLWDAASGGTQQPQPTPATLTVTGLTLSNGAFTVNLDFGANSFPGTSRFLQIAAKKPAEANYTTLAPRQQIFSSPYSIKTLLATASDSLSSACSGCVDSAKIANGTIVDADINSSAAISGSKISGNITGNAANVTGTIAIANGGTGAANAAGARTSLGLGTLAIVSPSGTASSATFLRGDNSWAAIASAGAPVFAARSTNLIVNSSTFVDVISINLEANKTYFIDSSIIGQRVGTTTGNGNFHLVYTGAATTDYGFTTNGSYINDTTIDSTPSYDMEAAGFTVGFTTTVNNRYALVGYLRTTSAGTLTIRAARASSNTTVDLNIREGSYLIARPLN
jgi:hypothetical protein